MGDESRVREYNLVTGIDDDLKKYIKALHIARGDHYIFLGINCDAHHPPILTRHCIAQFWQAIGQSIHADRRIAFQLFLDGAPYRLWRAKRGQAQAKDAALSILALNITISLMAEILLSCSRTEIQSPVGFLSKPMLRLVLVYS